MVKNQKPTKKDISTVLKVMSKNRVKPNFFCSLPYLLYNEAHVRFKAGMVWAEVDGICLFPPILENGGFIGDYPVQEIWSDFAGFALPCEEWEKKFLDWEYLYNPYDFQTMRGGRWETFRKNSRKWPKNQRNLRYGSTTQDEEERWALVAEWLEKRQDSVHDAEVVANYVMNPIDGVYQKALTRDGELVGMNVWDDNHCYINFRFCIVADEERYLDEYMRYLFYTDSLIYMQGKLVNDGGVLGREGLERFKDKMNPVYKRAVYGWLKK